MIENNAKPAPSDLKPGHTKTDAASCRDDQFETLLGDASLAYQGRVTQMRINPDRPNSSFCDQRDNRFVGFGGLMSGH